MKFNIPTFLAEHGPDYLLMDIVDTLIWDHGYDAEDPDGRLERDAMRLDAKIANRLTERN